MSSKFRLRPIYISPYVFFGAALLYMAVGITAMTGKGLLVAIVVWLMVANIAYNFGKVPFLINIDSNYLTAYGLIGRRRIKLNKLKAAQQTRAFGGPINRHLTNGGHGVDVVLLKLSDVNDRTLWLQLGGLSEKDRITATEHVKSLLSQQKINIDSDTALLLGKWLRPTSFWSM